MKYFRNKKVRRANFSGKKVFEKTGFVNFFHFWNFYVVFNFSHYVLYWKYSQ